MLTTPIPSITTLSLAEAANDIVDKVQWAGKHRMEFISLLLANENWAALHPFDIGEAAVEAANAIILTTGGK